MHEYKVSVLVVFIFLSEVEYLSVALYPFLNLVNVLYRLHLCVIRDEICIHLAVFCLNHFDA